MNVFTAMLLDSYRELNSKKLFWITLILSGLVVAVFGMIGITDKGLKIIVWEFPIDLFNANIISPATFYKLVYNNLGVKIWLAWAATILALISTAGMIPDFIAGGAIELTLSKPVGRARLLLTKFVTCLLFTALQVTVFAAAAFLLIGIRGGTWIPGVFLAVPIIVLFYSYLFCVCTLVGVLTRSTIAALLITVLFWLAMFGLNSTDAILVAIRSNSELRIEALEARIARMEKNTTAELEKSRDPATPQPTYTQAQLDAANPLLLGRRAKLTEEQGNLRTWQRWTKVLYLTKTVLPKTSETIEVLERQMISQSDIAGLVERDESVRIRNDDSDDIRVSDSARAQKADDEFRSRPLWWIIGTSLGFEVVILGIATLIFCRRDF